MTTDLEELKRLCAGASAGPWQHHFDKIFAPSEKGGQFNVADVRGWGYFTGKGQGALGLDDGEGAARQDANAAFIAAARTALPALLADRKELVAENERLRAVESAEDRHGKIVAELRALPNEPWHPRDIAQRIDDLFPVGPRTANWIRPK